MTWIGGGAGRRLRFCATFGLVLMTVAASLGGCGRARGAASGAAPTDPAALVEQLVADVAPDGPYRDPSRVERQRGEAAIRGLLASPEDLGQHSAAFAELGFTVVHGDDPVTGRPFSMFSMRGDREPAWGALLVDRSAPTRVLVEVPHPGFDLRTEQLGVILHRMLPGGALLVAGAHRDAAGGAGDVAHNDRSMFHVMAMEFARAGIVQVQLHGFADRSLPDAHVVVSTGTGSGTKLAAAVADALQDAGMRTCRAWATACGQLEGTRNAQGNAAADIGAPFLHLELGWSVRGDPDQRRVAMQAVADGLARS